MIKIGLLALQLNRLSETLDSLIELALPVKAYTLIVICVCICRLDFDGGGVVLDGTVELPDLIIGEPTIKEGLEVRGQDF